MKAYLRVSINTHSSRAGGDHKRKRHKRVDPSKAQGLVNNTQCNKTCMLNCNYDRMSAGKGAKRSTSGAAGKKTTSSEETSHASAYLLPTEEDSS